MTDAPATRSPWSSPGALVRQWAGVLLAPMTWFIQFEASYGLVPSTCARVSTRRFARVAVCGCT